MKKFILPLLISLIPIFSNAQALSCDIKINGTSYSTYDLCVGEDLILNGTPLGGTAPYVESWTGGGGQLAPTNSNPTTFTATTPGSYTVVYHLTDAVPTTVTDTILITVYPLPNLFTSADQIICLGECVNITALTFSGDALFWFPDFIGNPVGDTTCTSCGSLTLNVCPTTTTDYYAMAVISGSGCIRTKKLTVTVIDLTVTATGTPNPICLNDTSCLTATPSGGIGPYSYAWSPATNIDDPNIATPCVWPVTNTNYCVTVTDNASGCTASSCFMVTVNPQQPPVIDSDTTICFGNCVDLTASGSGTIFDWSTGQMNVTTINVCPLVTTVYTVTMTDANGCTATDNAVVIVNPQLFANAGPDKFICYDDSVQIGGTPTASWGSAPYTYSWGTATGLSSTTVSNPWASPTSNITYTVTVTDAAGCTATDDVIVTVNPEIIVDPGNPPPMCLGNCVQLGGAPTVTGGTPAYSYNWSPAGSLDDPNIANPTACPVATTLYSLTVTDAAGCTETATVTVIVNLNPTAAAAADNVICSGESIDIGGTPTASGGTSPYTYTWSSLPVDASLGAQSTVSNPIVSPTQTTLYCVTVTDASGCTASDCVTITVNPSPTADAGTDQTVCQGICVAIGGAPTATGGTPPFTYQWSPAGSLNNATIANPTACPLSTTTYNLTVTDALGCTATDNVTITVNTATATAVANPATLCSGSCSNITATGGGTYAWSNGGNTAVINVCPLVTTTYTVTVTAVNGCTASASATVTVMTINLTAAPTTTPICPPACTDITATPSGGTAPYSYSWNTGGTTQVINVCPVATTNYTVTATDANGCTQSATATVNVQTATATANPPSVCNGLCSDLTATGGGTYLWNTGATAASINVCPAVTTSYTVTVTNGGCTMTASTTVNVTSITALAVPTTDPICLGACTDITASGSGGIAPYTYSWNTGGNTATINVCPASTTTYTCTVTDANGCAGTATATVNVITASVSGTPTSICPGGTAILTATGGGTYLWSTTETTASISVSPAATTTYTVTVTNSGCTASASFTVTVSVLVVNATASPTVVCSGSGTPVTLGTSPGTAYSWTSSPADPTLAGQTTLQNPVVTPVQTTTYTVTVTNSGCTATASVIVTVNTVSATALASPTSVCAGDCSTLTISVSGGQSPYTYSWSDGLGTGSSANPCPLVTTTYYCTITDANSCQDVASITVTVLPLPNAAINPASTSICAGGTVVLTASGGGTYAWSTFESTASISVSPNTTTTYTVTVTGANGCTAIATSVVNVTTAPTANISVSPSNSICSGDPVTLTASGGSNYVWAPGGQVTAVINVSPAVTTTYTVSVTQAGCTQTATASTTITVTQTPTVTLTSSIAPSTTICSGTCVTFTATPGALNYTFVVNGVSQQSGGSNIFTSCTLTNPSAIYVIASNGAVCDDTSSVINITVNPSPIVTIVNPVLPSICGACDGSLGTSVIGGTPPYTYLWSDGQLIPTAINLCAGAYSVTVTDANSCTAFTSDALNDPNAPLVTLVSDDADNSICTGDCITFTPGGTAVTYEFYVNGISQGPPGGMVPLTLCNLSDGDIVTVEGTDAMGCTGFSAGITVTVNNLPTQFSITGGGAYCTGSGGLPIGLNGSELGVTYYLWSTSGIVGSIAGTGGPIWFSNQTLADTFYVVAQNTTTLCQNSMNGTAPIDENPLPTVFTVTGGGSFCEGTTGVAVGLSGSQVLSDSISYQLLIDGIPDTTIIGNGGPLSFGNWPITGTYTIFATDIRTTCTDTMAGSALVTAYPLPTQYTVTGGGSYCSGGAGVAIGLSDSDPGVSYQLQLNGVDVPWGQLTGTGFALSFPIQTAAGDYSVYATGSAPTFCQSYMFDTVMVSINLPPNASAGMDGSFCEGLSMQLNASGAGVNGTYLWSPSTFDNDSISNPMVSPSATTTYTVTVTDANGCTDSDDVIVTVLPFTYPTLTATDTIFCSYEVVSATIDAGPGYNQYLWSNPPGTNTQVINVNSPGCYTVTVTALNACSATQSICIQQNPPMTQPVILADGPTSFCQPDSVVLYLNNPYYMFEWSSGSINAPTITVTETGAYYVTVTDSFGCKDTAGPKNVWVDPLPQALISYVDNDNMALTFDFYSNSLHGLYYSWDFGDVNSPSNTSLNENPSHNFTAVNTYTITLIVSNDCGSDTAYATIQTHLPYSGLSENSGIYDFDLYPNPTKDLINIDFYMEGSGDIVFMMYDALGQELLLETDTYMSGKQHSEMNLSELPKGVYMLKVSTVKGSFVRRIVKD